MNSNTFTVARIILGAADPEMARIREIAEAAGLPVVQAMGAGRTPGDPTAAVSGFTAYKAVSPEPQTGDIWVECAPAAGGKVAIVAAGGRVVDHHETGDPGYGEPPAKALEA